jgi:hypothetical protein
MLARFSSLLLKNRWFFALRHRKNGLAGALDATGYRPILPPKDRFWADPFLFRKGDQTFVFFEDYRYDRARGLISCAQILPDAAISTTEVVLDLSVHLSFPFIFEESGEIWMIPETSEERTVDLYRCIQFPLLWKKEKRLIDGHRLSDSVLVRYEDRWWMFTSLEEGDTNEFRKLCLFSAPSLTAEWVPHPLNPVVDDVSLARPGGRMFWEAGRLIRPAQDCSAGYGHSLAFAEVTRLNDREFRQVPVGRIGPDWIQHGVGAGTHGYDATAEFEVLDGFTKEPDVWGKLLSVKGAIRRKLEMTRR